MCLVGCLGCYVLRRLYRVVFYGFILMLRMFMGLVFHVVGLRKGACDWDAI